jgi:hypothetical protein
MRSCDLSTPRTGPLDSTSHLEANTRRRVQNLTLHSLVSPPPLLIHITEFIDTKQPPDQVH